MPNKHLLFIIIVILMSFISSSAQESARDRVFPSNRIDLWREMLENDESISLTTVVSNPEIRAYLACSESALSDGSIRYKTRDIREYHLIFGSKNELVYVHFLPMYKKVPNTKYVTKDINYASFYCFYNPVDKKVVELKVER